MAIDLLERVELTHGYGEDTHYSIISLNITNRCNLSCEHCFFYREGNTNEALSPRLEVPDDEMIEMITGLRDRHHPDMALWIGGEPMLRRSLLDKGLPIFDFNTIATNGTLPLIDFGHRVDYMVSVDGPPAQNDKLRGKGTFDRVMKNLDRLPDDFGPMIHAQCTVTNVNQGHLGELIEMLRPTRFAWITFSFYVPSGDGDAGLGWDSLEDRMVAVDEVRQLKAEHPDFVSNEMAALDLMSPENAPGVTANCALSSNVLPLFLDGNRFVSGRCPYGENVSCDLCGSNFLFDFALTPFAQRAEAIT